MAKQTFSSGQVLTHTQMNDLQSNDFNQTVSVKTGDYTLVVGDRGTRVVANSGSAIAFTVPNSVFTAGDTLNIHNISTGTLTVAAGAGVTVNGADVLTVSQWQGGTLYFTSASAAIWFPTAKTVTEPGLVLISSTTIGSAQSSVTVSNAFSSTYDNYRVVVSGGAASTNLLLRLTLGSTATGYYWGQFYVVFADGTTNATNGSNTTSIPVASGTTTTLNGVVDILAPNLAEHTVFLSQGSIATEAAAGFCNGYLGDTTQYTAFTLTTSTGTVTGGTIKVYGYRN